MINYQKKRKFKKRNTLKYFDNLFKNEKFNNFKTQEAPGHKYIKNDSEVKIDFNVWCGDVKQFFVASANKDKMCRYSKTNFHFVRPSIVLYTKGLFIHVVCYSSLNNYDVLRCYYTVLL